MFRSVANCLRLRPDPLIYWAALCIWTSISVARKWVMIFFIKKNHLEGIRTVSSGINQWNIRFDSLLSSVSSYWMPLGWGISKTVIFFVGLCICMESCGHFASKESLFQCLRMMMHANCYTLIATAGKSKDQETFKCIIIFPKSGGPLD